MRKVLIVAAVAVAMVLGGVWSTGAVDAAPTAVDVVVTGKNMGVIASTAAEGEVLPALAELNVLKVTSAKGADGKDIADLKGKVLVYVPVKAAEALVLGKAHQGKNVEVTGKVYKAESALLVGSFKEVKGGAGDFDALPTKTVTRQQVL